MKKLLCSDLGGPSECKVEISGNSFEEIGKQCQAHVMEEINKGEETHMEAMESWKGMSPDDQEEKFGEFKEKYNSASEV